MGPNSLKSAVLLEGGLSVGKVWTGSDVLYGNIRWNTLFLTLKCILLAVIMTVLGQLGQYCQVTLVKTNKMNIPVRPGPHWLALLCPGIC